VAENTATEDLAFTNTLQSNRIYQISHRAKVLAFNACVFVFVCVTLCVYV